MGNTENHFTYTYSAKEQDEIKKIREKYQTPEEKGIDKLRKLDEKVSQKATIISLVLGVMGALILGIGMSFAMTDLGVILGMSVMFSMVVGILTGLVGLVLVAMAYPVYNKTLKKEREKIAPEILQMADELMH